VFPGRRGGHVTPTTVWTWSRRLGRVALGAPVATHVLRHTAIATLNDCTRDLRTAQEFARHASPETTVIYTRVRRDRLVAAVAAIDYGGGT
jgi:integrase